MDNMTIEDMKEYKRNAIDILRKNSQYATAKATEKETIIFPTTNFLLYDDE